MLITIAEINAEAKKWLDKNNNQEYFTMITGPSEDKKMKLPVAKAQVDAIIAASAVNNIN